MSQRRFFEPELAVLLGYASQIAVSAGWDENKLVQKLRDLADLIAAGDERTEAENMAIQEAEILLREVQREKEVPRSRGVSERLSSPHALPEDRSGSDHVRHSRASWFEGTPFKEGNQSERSQDDHGDDHVTREGGQ